VVAWAAISPVGWRVGAVGTVGFRYYNPGTGRYISRDPLGYKDGLNNYLYVHNNPINSIDPLGLEDSFLMKIAKGAIDQVAEVFDAGSGLIGMGLYAVSGDHQMMGIATTFSEKSKAIERREVSTKEALADATPVVSDAKQVVEAGVSAAQGDFGKAGLLAAGVVAKEAAQRLPFLGNIIRNFMKGEKGKTPEGTETPAVVYRTGSQTDNALTDSTGVSFRDTVSSSNPQAQTFKPGEKNLGSGYESTSEGISSSGWRT
jgi:uncharacterized protein RhaS with RHS repeats